MALKITQDSTLGILAIGLALSGLHAIGYRCYLKNLWIILGFGIAFRIAFVLAFPQLSPDYFRFFWDSNLLLDGHNPYVSIPSQWAPVVGGLDNQLFLGMTELTKGFHTNYPPVHIGLTTAALYLANRDLETAVVILRLFVLFAELGIFFFGSKLLKVLHIPTSQLYWYFLNPLIIIELNGNLHLESIMLLFLMMALLQLVRGFIWSSGVLMGLAIGTKLLPLLFLPLLWHYLGWQKFLGYIGLIMLTLISLFLPFLSLEMGLKFGGAVGLWFNQFEFNASSYYLLRKLGFLVRGQNEIDNIGPFLSVVTLLVILWIAYNKANKNASALLHSFILSLSLYLFLATTVHPWYLATLVLLSLFSDFKYPILWSSLAWLSYVAYAQPKVAEHPWILALEYLPVYFLAWWEWKKYRSYPHKMMLEKF